MDVRPRPVGVINPLASRDPVPRLVLTHENNEKE